MSTRSNVYHIELTFRVRPLPEEMFNYARSDTHFLLHIYDNMRNELIDKSNLSQQDGDLIEIVMDRSKEETLQRYERPFYDAQRGLGPMGWYNMLGRTPALLNQEQFAVFREVHQWRDRIAREEDESVHFVMPKHVLYNLAREMPVDMPTLLGCSHPISKSFKNRKSELLAVIKKARTLGRKDPDIREFMHSVQNMTVGRFSNSNRAEQLVPAPATAKMALSPHRTSAQGRNSHFWGSVAPNNIDRRAVDEDSMESPCLALPVARLTAEIFEATEMVSANATERSEISPAARVGNRKSTVRDVFVAKEARGPRRPEATYSYNSPNAVYSSQESNGADNAQEKAGKVDTAPNIDNEEQKHQDSRASNKAKENKRAWRLESKRPKTERLRGDEDAGIQKFREVEPFDYASAPSVLHAQRESNGIVIGKETNPYTKANDSPRGLRRARKQQEGNSLTFMG